MLYNFYSIHIVCITSVLCSDVNEDRVFLQEWIRGKAREAITGGLRSDVEEDMIYETVQHFVSDVAQMDLTKIEDIGDCIKEDAIMISDGSSMPKTVEIRRDSETGSLEIVNNGETFGIHLATAKPIMVEFRRLLSNDYVHGLFQDELTPVFPENPSCVYGIEIRKKLEGELIDPFKRGPPLRKAVSGVIRLIILFSGLHFSNLLSEDGMVLMSPNDCSFDINGEYEFKNSIVPHFWEVERHHCPPLDCLKAESTLLDCRSRLVDLKRLSISLKHAWKEAEIGIVGWKSAVESFDEYIDSLTWFQQPN